MAVRKAPVPPSNGFRASLQLYLIACSTWPGKLIDIAIIYQEYDGT